MSIKLRHPISVAVLAYNEEERIADSLHALFAGETAPDEVHVMVNGSRDRTGPIVRELAAANPRIRLHEIPFGDKSNAWNTYVYKAAPAGCHHVFLDGDVRPSPGAVRALINALEGHPEALAASALPAGGRRSKAWAEKILENHGLPGNLYALSRTTVERIKASHIFLPVGFIGDDTILRWLLLRDLDPAKTPVKDRIRPAAEAYFNYESFPVTSREGLRALYKRHRRYSRRDLEMALLTDRLTERGIPGLPKYISELYPAARLSTPLRSGLIPRQVFALATVMEARSKAGLVPPSDPWTQVFET